MHCCGISLYFQVAESGGIGYEKLAGAGYGWAQAQAHQLRIVGPRNFQVLIGEELTNLLALQKHRYRCHRTIGRAIQVHVSRVGLGWGRT